VSVAILTFTIGITLAWAFELVPRLETALVDRFFAVDESDLRGTSPTFFDPIQDSNQIYRVIIRETFTFPDTRLIVIRSETTGCPMYEDDTTRAEFGRAQTFHEAVKEFMPEVDSEILDNYLARNKTPQPLLVTDLGTNYVVVADRDLPDDGIDRFWTKFYQKYPRSSGLISFSNVGFNAQHNQAFVYAARGCGGLCGEGSYVLLRKVNGKWEIVKDQGLWVS